jgi:hypothetical protein
MGDSSVEIQRAESLPPNEFFMTRELTARMPGVRREWTRPIGGKILPSLHQRRLE